MDAINKKDNTFPNAYMQPNYKGGKWCVNPYASTQTILSSYIKDKVNYNDDVQSKLQSLRNIYKCAQEIILLRYEYFLENKAHWKESLRTDEAIDNYMDKLENSFLDKDVEKEIVFIKEVIKWI